MDDCVKQAYLAVFDGWSADELLLDDERNRRYQEQCRDLWSRDSNESVSQFDWNWRLLSLRKAGKLPGEVTRRTRMSHDDYWHAAEIAARLVEDRSGLNVDRFLCDPQWRGEFDREATKLAPEVSVYRLRKAAMGLRKARRLRPELVGRGGDWQKEVQVESVAYWQEHLEEIPAGAGIYVFRDAEGYVYVGESKQLRRRLAQHLLGSDRDALAGYLLAAGKTLQNSEKTIENREQAADNLNSLVVELHVFGPESPGQRLAARRAYESELIRSRQPRLNLRP
jgi:hypothetical protein